MGCSQESARRHEITFPKTTISSLQDLRDLSRDEPSLARPARLSPVACNHGRQLPKRTPVQARGPGGLWIEGDPDVPDSTERSSSRNALLKSRLTSTLRKLNFHDGQPWLDDA